MVVVAKKIVGGKLIKLSFTTKDDFLVTFKLYGDFFLHPENTLDLIEQRLVGVHTSEIASVIQRVLDVCEAEFIGVTPQDIQEVIETHEVDS